MVVLAPGMDEVAAEVRRSPLQPRVVIQEPQLGTGHALQSALPALPHDGTVLVLYRRHAADPGRRPCKRSSPRARTADAAVAVLGMRPPDPAGYGRLRFAGQRPGRDRRGAATPSLS